MVDSRLETPPGARVLEGGHTLIVSAGEDGAKMRGLQQRDVEIVTLPGAAGKVELGELMRELARREINEVHVEAGFRLNGSLLREGLVDELVVYLAPHLIGDAARGMFRLPELASLEGRKRLQFMDLRMIDGDIRVVARVLNA